METRGKQKEEVSGSEIVEAFIRTLDCPELEYFVNAPSVHLETEIASIQYITFLEHLEIEITELQIRLLSRTNNLDIPHSPNLAH